MISYVFQVEKWTIAAMEFLVCHKFVRKSMCSEAVQYVPTALGHATILSGIPPKDSIELMSSLCQARVKFIIKTGFHGVYLATPPSFSSISINWSVYMQLVQSILQNEPELFGILDYLGIIRLNIVLQFLY